MERDDSMDTENPLDVVNAFLEMVNTEKPPEDLQAVLRELADMNVLVCFPTIDRDPQNVPHPPRLSFTGEMFYRVLLDWYLRKVPGHEDLSPLQYGDFIAATLPNLSEGLKRNGEILARLEKIYGPIVRQAALAKWWLSTVKEGTFLQKRGDKRIWDVPWHLNSKEGWWGQSWLVWFVGIPGSGKSTLAAALYLFLLNHEHYLPLVMIDGDMTRRQDIVWAPSQRVIVPLGGRTDGTDFTKKTRLAHAEEFASFVASLTPEGGKIIGSTVFPYTVQRTALRKACGDCILLIEVSTPVSVCRQRKRYLYEGGGKNSAIHEFEAPTEEDWGGAKLLSINTSTEPIFQSLETIILAMESLGWIERGPRPIKCSTLGI